MRPGLFRYSPGRMFYFSVQNSTFSPAILGGKILLPQDDAGRLIRRNLRNPPQELLRIGAELPVRDTDDLKHRGNHSAQAASPRMPYPHTSARGFCRR